MSNYTGPVKSTGQSLTAAEWNALVTATNSKTELATVLTSIRNGVPLAGDDLNKLYNLLTGKQAAGDYATLVGGKIPAAQLPAYVDDVLEFANPAAFPATGASGVLYIDTTGNATYRWSGSAYVNLASGNGGVVLGETSSTAYRGDRGKTAYDHSLRTDNPHSVTKAQVGLPLADNTADANKPVSTAQAAADIVARDAAISTIRAGVSSAGDTLAKLYALILAGGNGGGGGAAVDQSYQLLAYGATVSIPYDATRPHKRMTGISGPLTLNMTAPSENGSGIFKATRTGNHPITLNGQVFSTSELPTYDAAADAVNTRVLYFGYAGQEDGSVQWWFMPPKPGVGTSGPGGGDPVPVQFATITTIDGENGNGNNQALGFRYTNGLVPITIVSIERWVRTNHPETQPARIHNNANNAVLATVQHNLTSAPTNEWLSEELDTPLQVAAGQVLMFLAYWTNGGAGWTKSDFTTTTAGSMTHGLQDSGYDPATGAISGSLSNLYDGTNKHYGLLNFTYIPTP